MFVGSCGVGILSSIILASMAKSFLYFILFYGLFLGFFCGVAYVPVLATSFAYFPDNKGMVSGILMMAYGFSSVIVQSLILYLINPDNLEKDEHGIFPDQVLDRLPNTFRICALYIFCCCMIGAILMKSKK